MPRVPNADETRNILEHHVIGNKTDAAVSAASSTGSVIAYLKGLLGLTGDITQPAELTGTTDIDISAAVYTGFITLLTVAPATGECLTDLVIDLDWNKAVTGFDKVATAADTLDCCVVGKIDGTQWRTLLNGTQITANGDASLEDSESGQRFKIGMLGVAEQAIVKVKLSAERDDCEIPYRVTYRGGAAPTVTAVVAG